MRHGDSNTMWIDRGVMRWRPILTIGQAVALMLTFFASNLAAGVTSFTDDARERDRTAPATLPDAHLNAPAAIPPPANRYLIIHADHLRDGAEAWAAYRSVQGWITTTISVGDIAKRTPPNHNPNADPVAGNADDLAAEHRTVISGHPVAWAIQQYIRDEWTLASARGVAPEWFQILLLGDAPEWTRDTAEQDLHALLPAQPAEAARGGSGRGRQPAAAPEAGPEAGPIHVVVPSFTIPKPTDDPHYASRWEPSTILTDQPYQYIDDADRIADVPLGRLPARRPVDVMIYLQKVKQYELASPSGPWRGRVNFVAGEGRFGQLDRLIEQAFIRLVDGMLPTAWAIDMTYAKVDSPYCPAPADLPGRTIDRLNGGALLTNYLGHGSASGLDSMWIDNEKFSLGGRAEARTLLPGDGVSGHPIAILIACTTGRFDLANGVDSFGEALLLNSRGPVAVVAGTRVTHPFGNAFYHKHFVTALLADRLPTLGQVELQATRRLAELNDPEDEVLESMGFMLSMTMNWKTATPEHRRLAGDLYHLLGDPALRPAYPSAEVTDIRWQTDVTGIDLGDMPSEEMVRDPEVGIVSGRVSPDFAGAQVTITIEAARTAIPRLGEMQAADLAAAAAGDADANEVMRRNQMLANDRVIAREITTINPDGSFAAPIVLDHEARTKAAWIRVYVAGRTLDAVAVSAPENEAGGQTTSPEVDAFGAAPFPQPASATAR